MSQEQSLVERVASLKHDLGKYVAWRSANLDDEAWTRGDPELLEALRRDILATRERAGGVEAAWEVWVRLTAELPRPLQIPELVAVEAAVARLERHAGRLRGEAPEPLREVVAELREAQQEIRAQLRDLSLRLRREGA